MMKKYCTCVLSRVQLFATPWTIPTRLLYGISQQKYWNGLPFPPPGDVPDPEIEPASPALAGRFFITEAPEKLEKILHNTKY